MALERINPKMGVVINLDHARAIRRRRALELRSWEVNPMGMGLWVSGLMWATLVLGFLWGLHHV